MPCNDSNNQLVSWFNLKENIATLLRLFIQNVQMPNKPVQPKLFKQKKVENSMHFYPQFLIICKHFGAGCLESRNECSDLHTFLCFYSFKFCILVLGVLVVVLSVFSCRFSCNKVGDPLKWWIPLKNVTSKISGC